MNKEWFKEWFNTSYYHVLYQHRDASEASQFIDHLCKNLVIKKGSKILDLACGKGRHALHFAKKGYHTTGVDLAQESINIAKKQVHKNMQFEVHDMREPFIIGGYDYVFNLFTSFGYFEDEAENLKVLRAAADNLKSNGTLILDYLNVTKIIANLIASEKKLIDGIKFKINRIFNGKHIIKDIRIQDGLKQQHYRESIAALDLRAFKKMAQKAKLNITKIYGDYDLNDFDEQHSNRLILVMKKQ